jgi:hypothetical protein
MRRLGIDIKRVFFLRGVRRDPYNVAVACKLANAIVNWVQIEASAFFVREACTRASLNGMHTGIGTICCNTDLWSIDYHGLCGHMKTATATHIAAARILAAIASRSNIRARQGCDSGVVVRARLRDSAILSARALALRVVRTAELQEACGRFFHTMTLEER